MVTLNKAQKQIFFVYIPAGLAAIVIYVGVLLKPTVTKLFTLTPQVYALKSEIKRMRDDILFESRLKSKLEVLEGKMADYQNKLSPEKELPVLLENLSDMANRSNVKILAITPLATGKEQGVYQEISIAVSAISGYHEAGLFINRLENAERYMQVSNIKITSNKAHPRKHDIAFIARAYTFKGEE